MTTKEAPLPPTATSSTVENRSRPKKDRAGQYFLYLSLVAGGILMIAPIMWVFFSAFKRPDEILRLPIQWLPDSFANFSNFTQLFVDYQFDRYVLNSFVVSIIGITSSLIIAIFAAYAFSFFEFRFKEPLFVIVIALFMIPQEALVLPLFLMISKVGLVNTYVGLAFPDLFTVLGVFLLRQFMEGIPKSYVEAARIDGASEFRIMARIILPMVRPSIAVFIIIKFLFTWNTFLWPMLVAQSESMYTVTVGLVNFAGADRTLWNLINAATIISMIPTIILFITLQKQLVQGVAMSGMK